MNFFAWITLALFACRIALGDVSTEITFLSRKPISVGTVPIRAHYSATVGNSSQMIYSLSLPEAHTDWLSYLRSLSWDSLVAEESNISQRSQLGEIIESLSELVVIEPRVEVPQQCTEPPALPVKVNCKDYPDALIGDRAPGDKPKLAHMVLFSFEVDVLEIHLNELYDVVDRFFIFESTRTNWDLIEKPLIWERVRHQHRFRKFADKIVYMIMDDVEIMPNENLKNPNGIWSQERAQVKRRFEKFIEWNNKQSDPFKGSDLIGFGDADEVPNRINLHLLKKCTPRNPSTDIGIWFPLGRLTNAFSTDWPVPGHPYTLGDPTFHTMTEALRLQSLGISPNRMVGKAGSFLLGGMHMTRARWLPFMILESMTCSECNYWSDKHFVASIIELMQRAKNIDEVVDLWDDFHSEALSRSRTIDVSDLPRSERHAIVKIPWFLECNIDRYPYWNGAHDTRLDLPLPRY